LEREGLRVIRFWNNEILENIEGVLQAIGEALRVLPPPTPSREREGKSGEAAEGWA
jgi:very-short-patch-repair endonuclease